MFLGLFSYIYAHTDTISSMKRIALILFAIFIAMPMTGQNVKSRWLQRNQKVFLGVGLEKVNVQDRSSEWAGSIIINAYGLYGDAAISFADRSSQPDDHPSQRLGSVVWHAGYSLPVLEWCRVTPLIGMVYTRWDRSNRLVCCNEDKGLLSNETHYLSGFDYGASVGFHIKPVVIYLTATAHTSTISIGCDLDYLFSSILL